jgi:hypothetical protein
VQRRLTLPSGNPFPPSNSPFGKLEVKVRLADCRPDEGNGPSARGFCLKLALMGWRPGLISFGPSDLGPRVPLRPEMYNKSKKCPDLDFYGAPPSASPPGFPTRAAAFWKC